MISDKRNIYWVFVVSPISDHESISFSTFKVSNAMKSAAISFMLASPLTYTVFPSAPVENQDAVLATVYSILDTIFLSIICNFPYQEIALSLLKVGQ